MRLYIVLSNYRELSLVQSFWPGSVSHHLPPVVAVSIEVDVTIRVHKVTDTPSGCNADHSGAKLLSSHRHQERLEWRMDRCGSNGTIRYLLLCHASETIREWYPSI